MHKNKLEQYFLDKNLDVSFNTLGSSELLIELFVKETEDIVHSCYGKTSNHVKSQCYSKYYKMDERTKFTGFEKFEKLDKQLRNKMSQHVHGLLGMPIMEVKKPEHVFGSYLQELKNSFNRFKNPLLYLSGGIDSEFVALAMLDAGVEFTPVIFQWIDDVGKVYNIHDILYAVDFCNTHGLQPLMRKINLEKLWNNPEFELLAKETNVSSPQVNTYVYMIELMGQEFKDSTHVLGGEVRFSSRFDVNSSKIANFALAAKVPPASLGYQNNIYEVKQENSLNNVAWTGATLSLIYNYNGDPTATQTWSIANTLGTQSGVFNNNGNSVTGNWYIGQSPGGTGFDWRMSSDNEATWTAWTTMAGTIASPQANTIITHARNFSAINGSDVETNKKYVIELRAKSSPDTVYKSFIYFAINRYYTWTLSDYTTAGGPYTYSVSNGSWTIYGYAVGGGGGGGGAWKKPNQGESGGYGAAAGAGGGGGGVWYATLPYNTTSNGNNISVTVGAGGTGGTGALWPDNSGNNGAASTVVYTGLDTGGGGGGGGLGGTSDELSYGGTAGIGADGPPFPGGWGSVSTDTANGGGGGGAASAGQDGLEIPGALGYGGTADTLTLQPNPTLATVVWGAGGNGGLAGLSSNGAAGTPNTGNGGGGGAAYALYASSLFRSGGDGGSGRVIFIR